MIIKNNIDLAIYSRMNIGGKALNFFIPESEDDLVALLKKMRKDDENYHIISGGSNILINDKKDFKNVILLTNFSNKIDINNNIVEVGASVKLQVLIKQLEENNLGGIEYLYSVPGTCGGAVSMNAGTSIHDKKSISDFVYEVKVFNGVSVVKYNKEECQFGFRRSIFKKKSIIILSIKFKFESSTPNKIKGLIRDRLVFTRKTQDNKFYNLGSVFNHSNKYILSLLKKLSIGWRKGVRFSSKSTNWLINCGKGTFKQAMFLIKFTEFLHKVTFNKKIRREIIVWE